LGSGIRDPGWEKIRIRDKHPGSATLPKTKVIGSNLLEKIKEGNTSVAPERKILVLKRGVGFDFQTKIIYGININLTTDDKGQFS
jgi:hypothetical protein